ncbi:MAG: aromatic amino acid lyase [Acidobacteriota bacterium]
MVTLNGESLTLEQVAAVARGGEEVEIDAQAVKRMRASREQVERMAEGEDEVSRLSGGVGRLFGHDCRRGIAPSSPGCAVRVPRATPWLRRHTLGPLRLRGLPALVEVVPADACTLAGVADVAEFLGQDQKSEPGLDKLRCLRGGQSPWW